MNYKENGQKLRDLRKKQNMSLTDAAKASGLDRTYISKIENGYDKPSVEALNSLLQAYQATASDLENLKNYYAQPAFVTQGEEIENTKLINGKEVSLEMSEEEKKDVAKTQEFQINIPNNISVLYTDLAHVTASKYGVVIDFAQSMGPTTIRNVVARIGMSKEHAKDLAKILSQQAEKTEEKEDK